MAVHTNVLLYEAPELTSIEVVRMTSTSSIQATCAIPSASEKGKGWEARKTKQRGCACEQIQKLFKQDEELWSGSETAMSWPAISTIRARAENGCEAWPEGRPPFFYAKHDPCDMLVGSCSCGCQALAGRV